MRPGVTSAAYTASWGRPGLATLPESVITRATSVRERAAQSHLVPDSRAVSQRKGALNLRVHGH